MFKYIIEDINNVFEKDPAAKNVIEVILCYPGLHAVWFHRIANWFYRIKWHTIARIISHVARHFTGIEIHPGAVIGHKLFIDHGMGVVIGETAEIGDNCLIYKGVLLGGTSLKKEKRHPTLKNNVVIGSNAIILGAITLGNNSRIGAGSVVIHDVPENATAVGVPARIGIGFSQEDIHELEHNRLPDPIAEGFKLLLNEINNVNTRLKKIESAEGITSQINDCFEKKKKEIEEEFK